MEQKLEEYFRSLHAIIEHSRYPKLKDGATYGDLANAFQQEAGNLVRCLAEPHMFAHLYFPSTIERFERLGQSVQEYNHWMHDYGDPNLPYELETGQEIFTVLNQHLNELKQYLVQERLVLTEAMGSQWH